MRQINPIDELIIRIRARITQTERELDALDGDYEKRKMPLAVRKSYMWCLSQAQRAKENMAVREACGSTTGGQS